MNPPLKLARRQVIQMLAGVVAGTMARLDFADAPPATAQAESDGPFQPSPESFKAYRCPDWFRDAKFGIWSHWGPQSIPGIANDYAANLYHQGSKLYDYHLAHYGHPSEKGYKDVIRSWRAEKFDPDALMQRYKAAGARYFVSLATHHDNFDTFDSGFYWNATNVGPSRDIVGLWREAALKQGLRFGVSSHADRAWKFYLESYGSDPRGSKIAVPYDGANVTRDPNAALLYGQPHGPKDKEPADFIERWASRHRKLIGKYQPDLLYFDGGIPFPQQAGDALVAHFLNENARLHGGKVEAVINVKSDGFVKDFERGQPITIQTDPWQCDTSLGGWFFLNDPVADYQSKGKDATTVIHNLADIVSKNGNLLLNLPQRGDGSLYPECEKVLDDLAKWVPINGEAIFDTRPWLTFGEGPSPLPKAMYMNELKHPLTWQDVRFTSKGNALYALCLGVPPNDAKEIRIASLGRLGPGVDKVQLLGSEEKLVWKQEWDGLAIQPLAQWPCDHAVTFKIGLKS